MYFSFLEILLLSWTQIVREFIAISVNYLIAKINMIKEARAAAFSSSLFTIHFSFGSIINPCKPTVTLTVSFYITHLIL